jgi:hypothetical protein
MDSFIFAILSGYGFFSLLWVLSSVRMALVRHHNLLSEVLIRQRKTRHALRHLARQHEQLFRQLEVVDISMPELKRMETPSPTSSILKHSL